MVSPPMVYKSNALVEAAYRLSVLEQRILLACISKVRRDEPVTDEVMYSVTAEEISTMAGVPIESSYSQLKEAALRLKRREVRLTQEPNGEGKRSNVMITGWVQTIVYQDGEGRVKVRFNTDMLPYLTELTKQFTKYALADVAKMESTHAIRLYELLMQWDTTGQREIELEKLREWFQLEGRYPSIKDFKLRVLEPAIAQINEHSPLQAEWTQRKTGRKVTHLLFKFGLKKPAKTAKKRKGSKFTDAEIAEKARPGETWEAARTRLNQIALDI
jgi:plasmid replication initiation protein